MKEDILRQFRFCRAVAILLLLGGCSLNDSHTASRAQTALLGMKEVDLQTCMGAPDEKSTFGSTEVLTYYATSTSSTSISIPLIGGIGESYGGYCHTIVRIDQGVVDSVRYTGETSAFVAPDAYCAPTVRGCVGDPPKPLSPPMAKTAMSAYWVDVRSRRFG